MKPVEFVDQHETRIVIDCDEVAGFRVARQPSGGQVIDGTVAGEKRR